MDENTDNTKVLCEIEITGTVFYITNVSEDGKVVYFTNRGQEQIAESKEPLLMECIVKMAKGEL